MSMCCSPVTVDYLCDGMRQTKRVMVLAERRSTITVFFSAESLILTGQSLPYRRVIHAVTPAACLNCMGMAFRLFQEHR